MAPAATATSLPALLTSLTQSLSSSFEVTPKLAGVEPPKDGLSLLDVKNELLLSYLQNLVFLILLKIRDSKTKPSPEASPSELHDAVVKKLVELRLYLEKGVRPLEDKLRYQIEKILRAVDDAERHEKAAADAAKRSSGSNGVKKGRSAKSGSSDSESASDEESGSDQDGSDDEEGAEEEDEVPTAKLSEMQFRPNLSALGRPAEAASSGKGKGASSSKDGIYRPPKIAPTTMPTTERRDKSDRRARALKSATMDEFVRDELSSAPLSQPSIGTNIQGRGRHVKTAAERKEEDERRAYEETNFIRLPKESKKERAQKAAQTGRSGRMTFGGEEWRDLGEGVDRIHKLTQRKDGGMGGSTRALLDKSRKRGLDTVDGPRASGAGAGVVEMGERYQKRLKVQDLPRNRGKKR